MEPNFFSHLVDKFFFFQESIFGENSQALPLILMMVPNANLRYTGPNPTIQGPRHHKYWINEHASSNI
jgi:hypothetical protein